jgi:hypothetical protein
MNTYRFPAPRFAFGVAAVALSVATIGAAVIAPAQMNFRTSEVPVVALSGQSIAITHNARDTTLVDSIDVNAVREARLVTVVESLHPAHASRRG